jgi:4a-hydroxytetrahydrobiopterin dehydratase
MNSRQTALEVSLIEEKLLNELPNWRYHEGWIVREYRTSGWKSTLMVVNVIGHLAEAAWHHPDLAITYAKVKVKLTTHSAKGVTELDFALARKFDEVVLWRAQEEFPGILEGTPDDPRFKYIRHDERS